MMIRRSMPIERNYIKSDGRAGYRWGTGRIEDISMLIWHFNAGYTARHSHDVLTSRKLSAHGTIGRDGVLYDHVGEEHRTWHAGGSSWNGRSDLNQCSIGIEAVSFGHVEAAYENDGWIFDYDEKYPYDKEIQPAPGNQRWYRVENGYKIGTRQQCGAFPDHRTDKKQRMWPAYTSDQITTICEYTLYCILKYHMLPENVVGHEHVAPMFKQDPGPAFYPVWLAIEDYIEQRLNDAEEEDRRLVFDPEYRQSERIQAVQSHLKRLGVYDLGVDGLWGPGTQDAAEEAVEVFGSLYGFHTRATKEACYVLANSLRLIPGYDPASYDPDRVKSRTALELGDLASRND